MAKTTKQPTPKTTRKSKATPAPKPEREANRYLRGSRIIVASGDGEGIDIMRLVAEGGMSRATAGHVLDAYKGVCAALREGGLLKRPAAPAKAPTAPRQRETTPADPTPEPDLVDA